LPCLPAPCPPQEVNEADCHQDHDSDEQRFVFWVVDIEGHGRKSDAVLKQDKTESDGPNAPVELASAGSVTQHDKIPDNLEKLEHMPSPGNVALLMKSRHPAELRKTGDAHSSPV
jgi:hypothetical protein